MMNNQTIKMYAHRACPDVPAVTAVLKGAKVDYEYINIHEDHSARANMYARSTMVMKVCRRSSSLMAQP